MTPQDSTSELRAAFDELIAAEFPEYQDVTRPDRSETALLGAVAACAIVMLVSVYWAVYRGLLNVGF